MEINADPQDILALDNDRSSWLLGGMKCPVDMCSGQWYHRYGSCLDHWIAVHKATSTIYQCSTWRKNFTRSSNARKHVCSHVPPGQVVVVHCPNRHYLPPGTHVLPNRFPVQSGTWTTDSSLRTHSPHRQQLKEEAIIRRHALSRRISQEEEQREEREAMASFSSDWKEKKRNKRETICDLLP